MASNSSRTSVLLHSSPSLDVHSSFQNQNCDFCEESDQHIQIEDLRMRKSSITLKPRISQKSLLSDNNQTEDPWFLKLSGWLIEITSLILAVFTIAAVVLLLRFYEGKPISEIPSWPSLNTIVTILSMAFSAFIMAAVTSGKNISLLLKILRLL